MIGCKVFEHFTNEGVRSAMNRQHILDVSNYERVAREAAELIGDRPIILTSRAVTVRDGVFWTGPSTLYRLQRAMITTQAPEGGDFIWVEAAKIRFVIAFPYGNESKYYLDAENGTVQFEFPHLSGISVTDIFIDQPQG
jgi:hypothetical protein